MEFRSKIKIRNLRRKDFDKDLCESLMLPRVMYAADYQELNVSILHFGCFRKLRFKEFARIDEEKKIKNKDMRRRLRL